MLAVLGVLVAVLGVELEYSACDAVDLLEIGGGEGDLLEQAEVQHCPRGNPSQFFSLLEPDWSHGTFPASSEFNTFLYPGLQYLHVY